ncbi:GNAT family N-acetyltransferase [Nostoc sp.]|uniref:GNAT family N-acetyltransferase n=1 Tax=Nostoc sp. TaxID=1180 RepID=UPI002FF644FF
MKIYQLTAVQRVSTASGYLRLATESDRSLLIEWLSAFLSEIDQAVSEDVEHQVDNRLKEQNTYFWVDSTPVSVASGKQVLPTIGRINLAYTPPEYRRQGYATACVAALSQKLLEGMPPLFPNSRFSQSHSQSYLSSDWVSPHLRLAPILIHLKCID